MTTEYNPVGWFEIPVTDMDRAKAFYEHVFAVTLDEHQMGELQMAWFPMQPNATGAAGSLVKGENHRPTRGGILVYFSTPDIDTALVRAREKGGKVLAEKFSIGEYGFVGMATDSEGNTIGLHSRA